MIFLDDGHRAHHTNPFGKLPHIHTRPHTCAHTLSSCRRRQLLLKIVRNSKRDYETHAVPAGSNLPVGLHHPTLASTSSSSSSPHHTNHILFYYQRQPGARTWLLAVRRGRREFCLRFAIEHYPVLITAPRSTVRNAIRR